MLPLINNEIMRKYIKTLVVFLFLVTLFGFPAKVIAQSGPCEVVYSVCQGPLNNPCTSPLTINTDDCVGRGLSDCNNGSWSCENPVGGNMACVWNLRMGSGYCEPVSSCQAGFEPEYDCSQHDQSRGGSETECEASRTFNCVEIDHICNWTSYSCEPFNVCSEPEIVNPAYEDLCHGLHSSSNPSPCLSATIADLGGNDQCIEPDGWYCLPNSGIAAQCAYCFNPDCAGKDLISYDLCDECNKKGGLADHTELCKIGSAYGIDTAIGCIPIGDPDTLTEFLLKWGLGIGGGIAFILIIYSGYIIMTGSGNPQRIQAGKELLTSALTGLLLMVFALFILRLIGIDILGIPL